MMANPLVQIKSFICTKGQDRTADTEIFSRSQDFSWFLSFSPMLFLDLRSSVNQLTMNWALRFLAQEASSCPMAIGRSSP